MSKRAHAHRAALDALEGGTIAAQLGLEPEVPGHVYAGEREAVHRVLDHYRSRGYHIEPESDGGYRVSRDDEPTALRILERSVHSPSPDVTPAGSPDASPAAGHGERIAESTHGPDRSHSHAERSEPETLRTIVLAGDDHDLRAAAVRARPRPGYLDVVVHGSEDSFWVVREQVDIALDHRALATFLEKQGLVGARLRLISCEAGKRPFAVAQQLADKLHVEVLAPSEKAWIDGRGEVGVGPRDVNRGQWHTFTPRREPPRQPRPEPYREMPPMRPVDGSEIDGPALVMVPHVDTRARVNHGDVARLGHQLGAKVVIDAELHNGVEVRAIRRKGIFGYDLDSIEIRVGTAALLSDVVAHARTIAGLRRYNGLLGRLRLLAERLFKGRSGADAKFPPGSRGHVTELELAKLEEMIEARHAQHAQGLIDQVTLFEEIAFLEGQIAFHEETLRSLADHGYLHDPTLAVGAPDIGVVTREAQAAGYKLPGELPGVGASADPNHYYYRRSQHDPTVFELARKPTAPRDAPAFRARVVNGKFQGLVDGAPAEPREVIPPEMSKADVVERLRQTEGFGPYADMLEAHGLASRAVIDAAITTIRGRKNAAGEEVTLDGLRREVKAYFRERVLRKLLDPTLDAQASYRNMRAMLAGLSSADRGSLAEVWYGRRYAPGAKSHVAYQVSRRTGDNAGLVEKRVADWLVNGEAREVKDVEGKIDEDQLGAYLDLLGNDEARKRTGIEKLCYVFTRPEGAIASLERLAKAMRDPDVGDRVRVEVFDASGTRHEARTPEELLALRARLARRGTATSP